MTNRTGTPVASWLAALGLSCAFMRRVWQGLAVVLVALSWTFTLVPPTPLPVKFAPAVFATICAVLLIVSQRATSEAPQRHVEDLQKLNEALMDDIGAFRKLRYGTDPRNSNLWQRSFRAHFQRVARHLREWDAVLHEDVVASGPVIDRVQRECGRLEATHGLNIDHCRAVVQRSVDSQLVTQPPAIGHPGPFSIASVPGIGWTLFLGGSGIKSSASQGDLAAAQTAFEQTAVSVANWSELARARNARLRLVEHTTKLRQELVEIGQRHALARVAGCPGCSN
jgi:hypothetical protein